MFEGVKYLQNPSAGAPHSNIHREFVAVVFAWRKRPNVRRSLLVTSVVSAETPERRRSAHSGPPSVGAVGARIETVELLSR